MQYVGVSEVDINLADWVTAVESGLQVVVFDRPLRVEALQVPFSVTRATPDAGGADVLLNANRQLADVHFIN